MTAMDELRRLLDERDVEYTVVPEDMYSREYIKIGSAEIWTNGRGEIAVYYLTPEQVVDATLGTGTCEVERLQAENAKLRELAKQACELARVLYDCGGTFNDLDDLLCEASELGIEVDA